MDFFFKKPNTRQEKGNTIFAAVLIVTVMLLVSTTIGELAYRGYLSSSFGLESEKAFYAADTAIECAQALDFNPTGSLLLLPGDDAAGYTSGKLAALSTSVCSNLVVSAPAGSNSAPAGAATTTVYLKYSSSDNSQPCAQIIVSKVPNGATGLKTVITANGYDVSKKSGTTDCSADISQTRRVQRTLVVKYGN